MGMTVDCWAVFLMICPGEAAFSGLAMVTATVMAMAMVTAMADMGNTGNMESMENTGLITRIGKKKNLRLNKGILNGYEHTE